MISGSSPAANATAVSPSYWRDSESLNQLTHGIGAVLSVIGAIVLVVASIQSQNAWAIVGCCIYSVSLVALYFSSTLSHSFSDAKRRNFYRTLDQVCIFVMMAGSYTPVGLTIMRQGAWWVLLLSMWAFAIGGVCYKVFVTKLENVSFWFYLCVAWLPGLTIYSISQHIGMDCVALILGGAACYMVGTYFFVNDHKSPYHHAIWHICVVVASACHYFVHLIYVV